MHLLTIGILVGIWIITLISELFISESKTQVYGYLHSYLQSDPRTAERLSKFDTFWYWVQLIDHDVHFSYN